MGMAQAVHLGKHGAQGMTLVVFYIWLNNWIQNPPA